MGGRGLALPYKDPRRRREASKLSQRKRRARLVDAGTPERRIRLVSYEAVAYVFDREVHQAWLSATRDG